jgi:hypothetical protein
MKKLWLYVLLVLSLGVNAGVLCTWAVRRYRQYRWEERLVRTVVKDRAALKQMDQEYAALMRRSDSLRRLMVEPRRRYGELGLEDNPDSLAVAAAIERMVEIDRARWEGIDQLVIRTQPLKRPEYNEKLSPLQREWQKSIDSLLAVDSIEEAAHKEGR